MFNQNIHRHIYIFGIIVLAIIIPFSPFLLSLGQFVLLGNWLLELRYVKKWKRFKARPGILFFISIYLMHVIWLFNTVDFTYALHDLKIKLPVFILPIIIGTSESFSRNEVKIILHVYIASIFVASLYSFIIFIGLTDINPIDTRDISPVISHIRLALYIVLSIYILIGLLIYNRTYCQINTYVYLFVLVWLIGFTIFLSAFTGLIILFLVSPIAFIFWLVSVSTIKKQMAGIVLVLSITLLLFSYLGYTIYRFNDRVEYNIEKLEKVTANNNRYIHYLYPEDYENKNRVWFYICEDELKQEWNKRSQYKYDGKDKKGQPMKGTLVRYLTSYGYRKDSLGISKLNDEDIKFIEDGYANHIYKKKIALYPRLYRIYWEMENYYKYGNPSGHSLTQRIEYVLNASRVIKRHIWLGTGTGDVKKEIDWQYRHDNSILDVKWRLRAHNQFVTTLLTFGIIGFIIIATLFIGVIVKEKRNIDFITFVYLWILCFSMFNEDTLETQAGVHFYAFFFAFFIFGRKTSN